MTYPRALLLESEHIDPYVCVGDITCLTPMEQIYIILWCVFVAGMFAEKLINSTNTKSKPSPESGSVLVTLIGAMGLVGAICLG